MTYRDPMSLMQELMSWMDPDALARRLLDEVQARMTSEERKAAHEKLTEHFGEIIMDVMLDKMNREQFEEFKAAYREAALADNAEILQWKVAGITAQIPGFFVAVTSRITAEFETLKSVLRD